MALPPGLLQAPGPRRGHAGRGAHRPRAQQAGREDYPAHDVRFASPAPVGGTATSHEYHQAVAREESRNVRDGNREGSGAWIFVMARVWTPPDTEPVKRNRMRGVASHTPAARRSGSRAARGSSCTNPSRGWSRRAACTLEVDPGVYRLVWPTPSGGQLAQAVVATAGWQTQVFVASDPEGTPPRLAGRSGTSDLHERSAVGRRGDPELNPDNPALRSPSSPCRAWPTSGRSSRPDHR